MIKYYRTCKDLVLYNFFEILDTGNYLWLVKGYDGYEKEVNGKAAEMKLVKEIWREVFDEYIILIDDEETKDYYRTIHEVAELEYGLKELDILLWTYGITSEKDLESSICEAIESIEVINFVFKRNKSKKEEYARLETYKKGLTTKINKIRDENEKIFKKKEEEEKKKVNRYEELRAVEKITKCAPIDPRTTVVAKYVVHKKEYEAEVKRIKKENGRRKG